MIKIALSIKEVVILNQKGVTLTELMIVIVVMGIIAAFSITAVNTIVTNTKEDSFLNTASVMITAAATANSQNGPLWSDNQATLGELIAENYMQVSTNDPWGKPYLLDESYVTIDSILFIPDGDFYLSTRSAGEGLVYKIKLVSETATIGYDEELPEFDNSHVVYATGEDNNFFNGLLENITGNTNSSITGTNDNDSITIEGDANTRTNITTFDGDDTVLIGNDMRGKASVDTGAGDDTVTLERWLRGNSTIDTGSGNDIINILEIRYRTKNYAGVGNDTVTIGSVLGNFTGSVHLDSGDDTMTISDGGTPFSGVTGRFYGGSGNDILNLPDVDLARWNQISNLFSGFETINLGDGTVITP